ncbi:MAG: ABC transporter permease [Bacteroidota bacterium]
MNKTPAPPRFLLRFFRWFCHPSLHVYIEGDLLELYQERVEQLGKSKADWRFAIDVLLLFRPGIIKPLQGYHRLNHYGMFKHYFKITWRSLLKQKLYSFINIGGLSIGLTCFILIFLYVQHELSYDRFLSNSNQIYRIYKKQVSNVFFLETNYSVVLPAPLATTLTGEFPEIIRATSIKEQTALLGFEENHYWEKGLRADIHFFEVFPYPFIEGNPKTALVNTESIVLVESMAKKIFGDNNPIGQSLIYQNGNPYEITGVIKDPPVNSSFKFSFITSIQDFQQYVNDLKGMEWTNNSYHTFFSLTKEASPLALQDKFPALLEKYQGHDESYPFKDTYFVQSLSELHLDVKVKHDIGLKGNPTFLSLFSLIALLVLLLACINYMNLAVARSIKRAREVGVRKVIGAIRWQLIGQFIGESILIAFLALLLALGLTYFLLPFFGDLLERPIELNLLENTFLLPGLLLLVIIVGVLSGSYPAFFMSSLRPIQVLKGKITGRFSGMKIQHWLIIGQYATSIILIICSLVIYQQFQFIQKKELGYNKEHIVTIPILDWELQAHLDALKNEWQNHPDIVLATTSSALPINIESSTIINDDDENNKEDDLNIYRLRVDESFLDVFNIELVAGRNFSPAIKTDVEEGYLLNESAARALGWTPEEAIGKQFTHEGTETVIGVVKDFHMQSIHAAIEPLMIRLKKQYLNFISVKVRPENLTETLAYLETSIKKYSAYPFKYKFLDEQFDQLYKADLRLGKMFVFFTVLSVLIASMGLFGLAAFTAEQRTKEIGIRKVLGASIKGIVSMLSKDFLKMVLFGFFIAVPIAWYIMQQWLQDFAYRIEIAWWMFVLAGFLALIVAFFTISSQSIKAALSNPVNSLRNE